MSGSQASQQPVEDRDKQDILSSGQGSDSSSESDEDVLVQETCETVKLIVMKTSVCLEDGLTAICLHNQYSTAPYMEFGAEKFVMRYNMHVDHDVLECEMESVSVNDLTNWPRIIEPKQFEVVQ